MHPDPALRVAAVLWIQQFIVEQLVIFVLHKGRK